MARREIYTKEIILEKTVDYIKEYSFELINARDLCKYIGCSTQPLFKNFINMDDFKKQLKDYLHNYYDRFIDKKVDKNNYLYSISYAYALFAYKESNVFKALFMTELAGTRTIKEILNSSWNVDTIISTSKQYSINKKQSEKLYRDVRFFTHGLACQIACNSIMVSDREIKELINNTIKKLKEVI